MRSGRAILGRASGFSLIEMIVVAAILSGISAVLYSAFALQSHTMLREGGNAVTQSEIRTVVERMVRELQSAGFDPRGTGRFGLIEAGGQVVRFSTDGNRDGAVEESNREKRGFDLQGSELRAWLGADPANPASWQKLVRGVEELWLEYLDAQGRPTDHLPSIRRIELRLRVRSQGESPTIEPALKTLIATIYLRNGS